MLILEDPGGEPLDRLLGQPMEVSRFLRFAVGLTAEPPEMIAGTLAYMAPEQTGRMNRSIDSRSDLYSLGVTFYEMLTGVLPFTASDPMEWVHCHIARQPVAPDRYAKEIPAPLSAIVMKLGIVMK
jgi:serine/threonine protein kinase